MRILKITAIKMILIVDCNSVYANNTPAILLTARVCYIDYFDAVENSA